MSARVQEIRFRARWVKAGASDHYGGTFVTASMDADDIQELVLYIEWLADDGGFDEFDDWFAWRSSIYDREDTA